MNSRKITPVEVGTRRPVLIPANQTPTKKDTFRLSPYFLQNVLRKTGAGEKVFEAMPAHLQAKVIKQNLTSEYINRKGEGIHLESNELKLILCLAQLSYEKSQTVDPKDKTFYMGNADPKAVAVISDSGAGTQLRSAHFITTLTEVTKAFYGDKGGGKNRDIVRKLIFSLEENAEKWAYIKLEEYRDIGEGRTEKTTYPTFRPLVKAQFREREITGANGKKEGKTKQDLLIQLHPIVTHRIAEVYVKALIDLVRKMEDAYDSQTAKMPAAVILFVLEMLNARSNNAKNLSKDSDGNPVYPIGEIKLLSMIVPEYIDNKNNRVKSNRKPLVAEYLKSSINVAIKIGLITGYEKKPSAKNDGDIFHFTLTRDF